MQLYLIIKFSLIYIVYVAAVQVTNNNRLNCVPSKTTVSGSHAPHGTICANTLILNENFNALNKNLWKHERSMFGGGVSKLYLCDYNYY